MSNTILKYGFFALLTAAIIFLAALLLGADFSYGTQAIIGYATMVVSLLFVFFGIKHFRDRVNNGTLTFRKAFIIGVFISLFAALGFAIIDYIYTTVINPDFMTDYMAEMQKQDGAEKIPEYGSGFLALIMFLTVLFIGIIISILSGLLLQRK